MRTVLAAAALLSLCGFSSVHANDPTENLRRFAGLASDGPEVLTVPASDLGKLAPPLTIEFWLRHSWSGDSLVQTTDEIDQNIQPAALVLALEAQNKSHMALGIAVDRERVWVVRSRDEIGRADNPERRHVVVEATDLTKPTDAEGGEFKRRLLYHVVIGVEADKSSVYVNGEFQGSIAVPFGGSSDLPLIVGRIPHTHLFEGHLGGIRLWRASLDDKHVRQLKRFERSARLRDLQFLRDFDALVGVWDFSNSQPSKHAWKRFEPLVGVWRPENAQVTLMRNSDQGIESVYGPSYAPVPRYTVFRLEGHLVVWKDGRPHGRLEKNGPNNYILKRSDGSADITWSHKKDRRWRVDTSGGVSLVRPTIADLGWIDTPSADDSIDDSSTRTSSTKDFLFSNIVREYTANAAGYNVLRMNPRDFMSTGTMSVTSDGTMQLDGQPKNILKLANPQQLVEIGAKGVIVPYNLSYRTISTGKYGSSAYLTQTAAEYGASLSNRLGTGASIPGVGTSFSLATSETESFSSMLANESSRVVTWAEVRSYSLIQNEFMELDDKFAQAVRRLASTSSRDLWRFFDEWGTHYAHSVTFGAQLWLETVISKESLSELASEQASSDVLVSSSEESTSERLAEILEKTEAQAFVVGGDASPDPLGQSVTTGDRPAPIHLDLRPVYELLSPYHFPDEPSVFVELRQQLEELWPRYFKARFLSGVSESLSSSGCSEVLRQRLLELLREGRLPQQPTTLEVEVQEVRYKETLGEGKHKDDNWGKVVTDVDVDLRLVGIGAEVQPLLSEALPSAPQLWRGKGMMFKEDFIKVAADPVTVTLPGYLDPDSLYTQVIVTAKGSASFHMLAPGIPRPGETPNRFFGAVKGVYRPWKGVRKGLTWVSAPFSRSETSLWLTGFPPMDNLSLDKRGATWFDELWQNHTESISGMVGRARANEGHEYLGSGKLDVKFRYRKLPRVNLSGQRLAYASTLSEGHRKKAKAAGVELESATFARMDLLRSQGVTMADAVDDYGLGDLRGSLEAYFPLAKDRHDLTSNRVMSQDSASTQIVLPGPSLSVHFDFRPRSEARTGWLEVDDANIRVRTENGRLSVHVGKTKLQVPERVVGSNRWHKLVFAIDGASRELRVMLDGSWMGSTACEPLARVASWHIGREHGKAANGDLRNVMIFSEAVKKTEMAKLSQRPRRAGYADWPTLEVARPQPKPFTSELAVKRDLVAPEHLISYYPFNGDGGDAARGGGGLRGYVDRSRLGSIFAENSLGEAALTTTLPVSFRPDLFTLAFDYQPTGREWEMFSLLQDHITGHVDTSGHIVVRLKPVSGAALSVKSTVVVTDQDWHKCLVSMDVAGRSVLLAVDGQERVLELPKGFTLPAHRDLTLSGAFGRLDEVMLFQVALDPQGRRQHATRSRFHASDPPVQANSDVPHVWTIRGQRSWDRVAARFIKMGTVSRYDDRKKAYVDERTVFLRTIPRGNDMKVRFRLLSKEDQQRANELDAAARRAAKAAGDVVAYYPIDVVSRQGTPALALLQLPKNCLVEHAALTLSGGPTDLVKFPAIPLPEAADGFTCSAEVFVGERGIVLQFGPATIVLDTDDTGNRDYAYANTNKGQLEMKIDAPRGEWTKILIAMDPKAKQVRVKVLGRDLIEKTAADGLPATSSLAMELYAFGESTAAGKPECKVDEITVFRRAFSKEELQTAAEEREHADWKP